MTVFAEEITKQGAYTGPINGAAADDNIKAHNDLIKTDTEAIIVSGTTAVTQVTQDEKCISKSITPIATGNLFVVAGGPIKILDIVGVVTDTSQAQANSIKLLVDPTAPGTDTDICLALEINADAIGTVYTIDGTVGNAMIATTLGVVASQVLDLICPIGSIEINGTASNTGTIVWYLRYMPLSPLSVVTAA